MAWYWYVFGAVCLVSVIYAVVYFVGYWVSANYYTKLSSSFKDDYKRFMIFIGVVNIMTVLPGMLAAPSPMVIKVALFINGILHLGVIVGLTTFKLKELFQRSRKYFANKRNIKI